MQAIPHPETPYRTGAEPLWMRHDRTPGDPHDDLLTGPEPAIGPVISAATNKKKHGWHALTTDQKSTRNALCAVFGIVLGILGAVFGVAVHEAVFSLGAFFLAPFSWVFAIAFGVAGLAIGIVVPIVLMMLARRAVSTIVGKDGVQRYTRGLFGPKLEVLRFADAQSLKVSRIRQFVNGVYSGTRYDYVWRFPNGKIALRLHGSYRDDGALAAHEPVVFAAAAERSWSSHRIAHFDRTIAQQGVARFACGRDWIGVGKGFLEIGAGGQTQRLAVGDLHDIHLEQGVLVMKKKGAREGLFSSDGVYRFPVAAMDDFQVFLVVLEEQTGVCFR